MVGNRIFGHSLILGMALALLLTPWGSIKVTPENDSQLAQPFSQIGGPPPARAQFSIFSPAKLLNDAEEAQSTMVLVNGLQGRVAIGKVLIPYWMIAAFLALGSVVACLNLMHWTRLSSVVTFALFGMAAACSLVAIIHFVYQGEVGTGSVLAMTCAMAGLSLSPADEEALQPTIHRLEAARRQTRAAA